MKKTDAACGIRPIRKPRYFCPALQRKSHLWISIIVIARPQSQFPHSCVCERFIYYQYRFTYFSVAVAVFWPFVEIYKSFTDIWMWKLGLRPCNSFSGNTCFEFSVLCLCSVPKVAQGHVFTVSPSVTCQEPERYNVTRIASQILCVRIVIWLLQTLLQYF